MFERVHLSSALVDDEHVSSTEGSAEVSKAVSDFKGYLVIFALFSLDETASISVDSTSPSELTPQSGPSASLSTAMRKRATHDASIQGTTEYKRRLLEKIAVHKQVSRLF